MEIIDRRISVETSRLAKEKGYDIAANGSYTEYLVTKIDPEYPEGGGPFGMTKGEIELSADYFANNWEQTDYSNKNYFMCAAHTQTLLSAWLRAKHDIHVEIYANASGWGYILTKTNGTTIKEIEDCVFFDSYEDAMETGLGLALERIVIA